MENEPNAQADVAAEMGEQYSLARILGIWALATIPMGILSWIVFPALSPDFGSDPLGAGVTRIVLLTFGLIWLFVLLSRRLTTYIVAVASATGVPSSSEIFASA